MLNLRETFFRLAASGMVPARYFVPDLPAEPPTPAAGRPAEVEIVSHCWRYQHLLAYQLSSLVLYPPRDVSITMTVCHTPEDAGTLRLLDFVAGHFVPNVRWNWMPLTPPELFRRSIGRNRAALSTTAEWIWFADCDLVFHQGALDELGRTLTGRTERLVFPRSHLVTPLLDPDDPILAAGRGDPRILDIDPTWAFSVDERERAVGALQIARGDIARTLGYCGTIDVFQEPLPRWRRTHDDRVFRWLIGTQGTPIEVPALYRIRHRTKGRKTTD
jgi:hypothetical protein